jgi:hypothetical protein
MQLLFHLITAYWWALPPLTVAAYLKTPTGKGQLGEALVNVVARLGLKRNEYRLLKNVTLPTADGSTQIDHVIVSRFGIFVIETKNYSGWIFGSARQKMWTQKFPGASHQFQNPLHQNHKHVCTLADLLELDRAFVHSLVVFAGGSTFKTPMPDNVVQMGGYLRFIRSKTAPILSTDQVDELVARIQSGRLAPTLKTNREHKQHVQALVAQKPTRTKAVPTAVAPAAPRPDRRCPKCSSALARRTIPTGARAGTGFTCCSRFPDCPFILDIRPPAAPTAAPAPYCNAAVLPPTG